MQNEEELKKYWKVYKKLPEELKNVGWSEETTKNLENICEKYGVSANFDEINDFVGQVILGFLPPDELQATLEEKVKLKKETAKGVVLEILRLIFYPVKRELENLYNIEIAPFAKMKVTPPPQEKQPELPKEGDVYRENIE